jgi:hypothetical protein
MLKLAFLLLTVVAGAGCAHRERRGEYREARAVDAHPDWVRLGERSVDGRHDHDVIHVGRHEGAFRKIMIAVERNPIELHHLVVRFQDGSAYSPSTRLVFGANTRSGVIDLPGSERVIRDVEFSYGNLPGSGRAEVELWGR